MAPHLNEGDQIAELKVTPDKYLPHRYAGASGDFNPIHIDPEFAKAVGLPGNILHGLYGMALVARAAIVGVELEAEQSGNRIIRNAEAELALGSGE
jgi:acyl dehydratase